MPLKPDMTNVALGASSVTRMGVGLHGAEQRLSAGGIRWAEPRQSPSIGSEAQFVQYLAVDAGQSPVASGAVIGDVLPLQRAFNFLEMLVRIGHGRCKLVRRDQPHGCMGVVQTPSFQHTWQILVEE